MKIYKHVISHWSGPIIIPNCAQILSVGVQHAGFAHFVIWYLHDETSPSKRVIAIKTGKEVPQGLEFIGTAQIGDSMSNCYELHFFTELY